MRTIVRAALAALAAAGAFAASPAAADSPTPAIYVGPVLSDTGNTVVQVNAGPGTWQIKRAARILDAQIAGVTVRTSGDCATADLCVNVVVDWYEQDEMLALSDGLFPSWGGLTTYPTPRTRYVYLNRKAGSSAALAKYRYRAAAHEMAHVLGLAHHEEWGLMGDWDRTRDPRWLSPTEAAVLNAYYATPPVTEETP